MRLIVEILWSQSVIGICDFSRAWRPSLHLVTRSLNTVVEHCSEHRFEHLSEHRFCVCVFVWSCLFSPKLSKALLKPSKVLFSSTGLWLLCSDTWPLAMNAGLLPYAG